MNESSVASPSKSLVAKLIRACNAVDSVEKKGSNDEYNYVRAADVARAIRRELFKRKILLTIDEKEVTEKPIRNHAGLIVRLLTLKAEFTLRDAESGETLTTTAFGMAADVGDKSLYKAKTGALKYFLRNLGIIPDESDPEADAHPEEIRETAQQKSRFREYQTRAWAAAIGENGRTPQQCAAYLLERFKISDVTLLDRKEFDEAMRWATGKADTEQTLQLSVHSIESAKKNGETRGV